MRRRPCGNRGKAGAVTFLPDRLTSSASMRPKCVPVFSIVSAS
jgi:hypothetical protein